MFWISYSVAFVLASAIAIVWMTVRLVVSVIGRAFESNHGNAVSRRFAMQARSRCWSTITKVDGLPKAAVIKLSLKS
jgi:hypothetical protein